MGTRRGRFWSAGLILVTWLVLTAAAPQPLSKRVLFEDTFSDGNDAGWTQINRYWNVTNGHYVLDGDYMPNSIGRNGYSVTHEGDTRWKNYVLLARFNNANPGGYPEEVHEAEFLVRVIKPPPFGTWPDGTGTGTYYAINVWPRGTVDPLGQGRPFPDGIVGIAKLVDGVQVAGVDRPYSNAVLGTNEIAITVVGHMIQVIVNGEPVLTWKDKDRPLTYGGIGVGTIWEVEAWFDDIRVLKGGSPGK